MMKKLMIMASLLLPAASCSKLSNADMIVVRDCTGTYLRWNGKDYRVCNTAATNVFASGELVRASIKTDDDCRDDEDVYCLMYHHYETRVKVLHIEENE